jgi:sortase A
MTRSRNPVLRCLELLLLATGLAGVGVWTGSKVIPTLWQAWETRQFDLAKKNPARASAARPKNGQLLGRLSIPRLGLSSMVREGDDETTLSLAVGHIPGTALPGEAGNVGVAGHRDTIFRALRGIRKDDLIQFETLSGAHAYQVDSKRIVKPDDVAVLEPGDVPALTLVTCYPFDYVGAAPDRFIVSAHEVPSGAAQTQTAVLAAVRQVEFHAAAQAATTFQIRKGESHEVAPGIVVGITDIDPRSGGVNGWVVLTAQQHTILLSDVPTDRPVVLDQDGRRRQLRFTEVSPESATGDLSARAE